MQTIMYRQKARISTLVTIIPAVPSALPSASLVPPLHLTIAVCVLMHVPGTFL